jgi:2-polyprenyl-6-methoxyphenol hydroxylase-like FAD-dependent oxidoreductase
MDWDVIVAGGGPSGLTVAAEMAGMGARVLVVERRNEGVQSRAGTILPRVLELLDARGIADRFVRQTREIAPYPLRPSHIWAGFHPIRWEHLETRFGFTLGLPQNSTEELLWHWAAECGVQFMRGSEVLSFMEHADGMSVDVAATEGGRERRTLSTRYLVGADGGRSTVRKAAGIPFEGTPGTFRGIVIDAEMEAPWPGGRVNVDNEKGWVRGYVFGKGITRFNIVHHERRRAPKEEPVTLDEALHCIRDVHGTDYGITAYRWASRFDNQMRWVPHLSSGRVFLVGESARVHYPASGVGMNFCLQDAFNLGWKLGYVVRGFANPSILDSYETERMPVMHALLQSVKSQCALQFNFEPEGVALKRYMSEAIVPLPDVQKKLVRELCGLTHPYATATCAHTLAGHHAPDLDLTLMDGTVTRLTALLRNRQFLLLDLEADHSGLVPPEVGDLPLTTVKARAGRIPEVLVGVRHVLIRPDAYVAWAGDAIKDAASLRSTLQTWLKVPA